MVNGNGSLVVSRPQNRVQLAFQAAADHASSHSEWHEVVALDKLAAERRADQMAAGLKHAARARERYAAALGIIQQLLEQQRLESEEQTASAAEQLIRDTHVKQQIALHRAEMVDAILEFC